MRKSLFLTLILSLCMADFGAFAANNRRGTTAPATQQNAAPASTARAAVRSARSATPATTQKKTVSVKPSTDSGAQKNTGVVAARAATKKALSMGTKVAAATENTAISQECQNAYYGCMDAFCMLDNAAGGRCQCSDRSTELDEVMDEIMRLDEQSARIASEGVEQIQMGEYASQINSMAKSVESGITTEAKKSASTGKKSSSVARTLDLSAFSTNNFFDVEDDGVFDDQDSNSTSALSEIEGKTGDALQKGAAKICTAQIPAECKSSLAVLQTSYVSKVKSDCIGYENALKQQRSASQQKLLTAQKAIRDAALEEVRRQNRYETAGECAVAFAQCMQTTAECGSDYTGCVTLAATENVKNTKKGSKAKQYTIKGVVSGADITIAATTMEQLLAKKEMCTSVTKQCVNANKNDAVWDIFVRNAAPALKSAELIAEQNLRSNCIPTAAECFKNACKSQFGEDDESYDMCLSNPATYKSLCKVQLEPCLEATGGSYDKPEDSSLWNGLVAMLNSMKVDACTKEIKDCLLSDDRCGKDFSNCVGLDTSSIGRMCPVEKLTACVTDGRYAKRTTGANGASTVENEDEIRSYIAQIAQGLALNIENSFLTQCRNAANEAMIKVCGDTESCDNIAFDLSTVETLMKVEACKWNKPNASTDDPESLTCLPDISQFGDDDVYGMGYLVNGNASAEELASTELRRTSGSTYGVYATLLNKPEISNITFIKNITGEEGDMVETFGIEDATGAPSAATNAVISVLKGALDRTIGQIESDPNVIYCKDGRQVQGFDNSYFGKQGKTSRDISDKQGRFPNLTDEFKYVIATGLLNKLSQKNLELQEKFAEQIDNMDNKITERVAAIERKRGGAVEAIVDRKNDANCKAKEINPRPDWGRQQTDYSVETSYNYDTNICTIKNVRYDCIDWRTPWWRSNYCDKYNAGTIQDQRDSHMPKFQ